MKRLTISQVFLYFLLVAFIIFSQCRKVNTTEMNRLAVNEITPTGGAGGDLVTIAGEGFSIILTEDTVTFNGLPAQINRVTDTSMEVVVPQGGSTGKITVKVRNNTAEGPVFTYLASDAPRIISIDPAAGWDYTTTAVTIRGKNFGDDRSKVSVTFDGKSASIQSFSATVLIVAPPEHIPGEVPVMIQVNGLSSNVVNYTYQQMPVINGVTNQQWNEHGNDFYYWVGVNGLSDIDKANKISVNGHDVTIYSIIREGDEAYSQLPKGEKITIKADEADQYLASDTARFVVTVNGVPGIAYDFENDPQILNIQPEGGYPFSCTLCKTTVITGKYFGNKNQGSKIVLLEYENQSEEDHMQAQIESWANSEIKINFCGDYNGAHYSPMYLKIKQNGKQAGAYVIFQAELDQLGTYDVSTLAGVGSAGFMDGMGTHAKFNNPSGMAVDSHGNIFVADELNNRIRKISPDGNVSTVAGGVTNKSGSDMGNIDTIQLKRPRGIAIDSHDNIFITQYHVCHILKINMAAGTSVVLAGSDIPGYSDGENTSAQFYYPFGLATDSDDYIYVADEYNQRIRKISPTGIVKTIAGDGSTNDLYFPKGVTVNSLGEVFVIDSSQTSGILNDGRIYNLSLFIDHPQGITIDRKDNIYITADTRVYCHYTLRDDNPGRNGVLTGNISGYRDGDDASAQFSKPVAITADAAGNVYVADGNAHIRKITLK